jgi:branched-chain amino acid transport system ATP-binding protein
MLEVKNIIKTFGGLCALDNVHFRVNKHDFLGLIGPNGAGKSVLVNTIAGLYKPDSGVVLFEGRNLVGYRVDKIAQMGIRRTFQISTLFGRSQEGNRHCRADWPGKSDLQIFAIRATKEGILS